jgi:N6-L-threonylcarbamoyladenine synthase
VVPEIACRAHIESILPVIDRALVKAGVKLSDLSAIAVTHTPGLVGALLVGVSAAKSLSLVLNKPLIGINHIEAHLYACHLASHPTSQILPNVEAQVELLRDPEVKPQWVASFGTNPKIGYPAIGLVASGGHTSLFLIKDFRHYRKIGTTIDDAAGEAFDKVSAILEVGYPGGPAIERVSKKGNSRAIRFPPPVATNNKQRAPNYDFSFSGLKTAVLYYAKGQNARRETPLKKGLNIPDIAASFQEVVANTLTEKVIQAAQDYKVKTIILGGGVSANSRLRTKLLERARQLNLHCHIPPVELCTDNGAMVAGLAYHKYRHHQVANLYLDAVS